MINKNTEEIGQRNENGTGVRSIGLQRLLVLGWAASERKDIARVAGEAGFEATMCSTPEQARHLLDSTEFHGLVFDAELYGENSDEFLRWLEGLADAKPYAMAVVDASSDEVHSDWLNRGVDDLLPKPFAAEALRLRLALMEQRVARRTREQGDLARLRRAQGRYESLFLEAPDAMLILKNRQGKVIGVNRAVKEILGYDGKALLGKYMSLVFPDIFGRDGLASRGDVLSGATVLQAIPYRRPDGDKRYLDIIMSAVPWDSGYAVMMVCRDVSGREGAEGERIQGSKDEAMSRFASGVSRDFGDVLTSVGGNLSLLETAPFLNDDARETIRRAQEACEWGRDLTSDVATLAGKGRGPRRKPVNLPGLIEKTVQFALFDAENVRPVFRTEEGLGQVQGDDGQLRQMIEAIAANAASVFDPKATGAQLNVELSNVTVTPAMDLPIRDGRYVKIAMRDNGPGMVEADLRRIFDPYFSTNPDGRGFGLTKASAIARAHGGHLAATSQAAKGSCFEIYLPMVESGTQEAEVAAVGSGKPAMRVLVLDDEPHIRLVLEKALTGAGHEVFCTSTGEEALRAYEKAEDFGRPFDVLLFDLDIRGGMGGRATLERIRAENPGVKAIVTTGYVDDTVLENYLEHGFCGVLCKPFRIEHLTATVERLGS